MKVERLEFETGSFVTSGNVEVEFVGSLEFAMGRNNSLGHWAGYTQRCIGCRGI